MANVGLSSFVLSLKHCAMGSLSEAIVTDSTLLDRFVAHGDQHAFTALVHRHGPMVLAVCRRVCGGDEQLAEDAFQAAFLVLARRAGDIQSRETFRAWLYGVAVRTARGARARSARRFVREIPMPLVPDRPIPAAAAVESDALEALDEEIARLPPHLRPAVLLCELDGLTRKEAAARLGIPQGTLSSRLGKARKLLARRLRGRGVILSAGTLTLLIESARPAAAVSPALANAAARLTGSGQVPEAVATVSRAVFRIMLLNKLKRLALLVVLVTIVGSATLWQARNFTWADDPPKKPAPAQADVSEPAGPGHILLYGRDSELYLMDPDGKNERRIELPPMGWPPPITCLSPDGRWLAFWTTGDNIFEPIVCIREIDGTGFGTKFELKGTAGFVRIFWSPNSQDLHVNLGGPAKEARHFRIDRKTGQVTRLDGLNHYLLSDQTRDGKQLLATAIGTKDSWNSKTVHLLTAAGAEEKLLVDLTLLGDPDGWVAAAGLSPDGRRALVLHNAKPCVIDIDKPGVLRPVAGIPKDAEVTTCTWAPDGKHIAYVIGSVHWIAPEDLKKFESRLIVADVDGGNPRVVRSVKGKMLTSVDWR